MPAASRVLTNFKVSSGILAMCHRPVGAILVRGMKAEAACFLLHPSGNASENIFMERELITERPLAGLVSGIAIAQNQRHCVVAGWRTTRAGDRHAPRRLDVGPEGAGVVGGVVGANDVGRRHRCKNRRG